MKRILSFLIAFILAFAINAHATKVTATFGDKNASNAYRLTASSDLSGSTNYGWVTYASDTGIYSPYATPATTNTTLVASQTGTTLIYNAGTGSGANGTMFTLPTSAVGMQFTIIADVATSWYVKPASGDIINYSTNATNNRIFNSSAALGDSITLFCATAGKWSIKNKVGTWVTAGN